MKEKVNVKAVVVIILFVILGSYFIFLEKQILNGTIIMAGGISLVFLEVVKWLKELFALIKSSGKKDNGQFQEKSPQSTQVITGNHSPVKVMNIYHKSDKKKENSEKIYAPLLTEFQNNLKSIKNNFTSNVSSKEWHRITQKDNIKHRIKPKVKQNLEKFYEEISKSYRDKYVVACKKIKETIDEEFKKREDEVYTLENTHNLIGYLYPAFIAGKILNNKSFLKQQLGDVDSQLKNKYGSLDNFFEENLKLLDQKKEIKEIREEQNKIIKHINLIIPLLKKELK